MLSCAVLLVAAGSVWAATINGTSRNDTLRGGAGGDKLYGKSGNDKLFGAGGNDTLVGGPGNDVLVGGPGKDVLRCGSGRDTVTRDVQDRVAGDCESVRGPRPAPPVPTPPAPPPAAPTPPPPVVAPQATYEFGASVPSRLQDIVKNALGFAGGYFRARLSREIPALSVYVYTDLEEIRSAWIRVQGGSIEEARRIWPDTDVQANAPQGQIFFFVRAGVGDVLNLSKIVVHEAFHNLQWSLLGGRKLGEPALTPVWVTEGSAEYIAYRTIVEYGLDTLDNVRRVWIERAKTSSAPLRALETYAGFGPQNSPYPLSALAADRLTQERGETLLTAYFETLGRGVSWQEAFASVFGKGIDTFYTEFEAYRSGL